MHALTYPNSCSARLLSARKHPVLRAVALCLGSLAVALAAARAGSTPVNPISYFQVQEGTKAISWSQTGATLDPSTGNSTVAFQDGNGGTSTMVWGSAGNLISWTLSFASGAVQAYTDGAAQGQPGGFALNGGAVGTNTVLAINGHPYVYTNNSTLLVGAGDRDPYFNFTYNAVSYTGAALATDYAGRSLTIHNSSSGGCVTTQTQGFQIYFPDGTIASYAKDQTNRTYTYQSSSTAPNGLTQINGFNLTGTGAKRSLPAPVTSLAWMGHTFLLSSVYCYSGVIYWGYSPVEGSVDSGLQDDGQVSVYGSTNSADGSQFWLSASDNQQDDDLIDISTTSTPGVYQNNNGGGLTFTAFNGVAYAPQGSLLVPRGPVGSFSYGGSAYQFTGSSRAENGNFVSQYQTSGAYPRAATAEYSPTTGALIKLTIHSSSNFPGLTATYTDGASVGQPGAYIWSSSSTAANSLSAVNNTAYNASGNSDLPSSATTANGVFQVKGNFMSLGTWANNSNQSGVDLSYYDGQPTATPDNIEFAASRPLTSWLWDTASQDGTLVNAVMQLDEASRLLLYPKADPLATAPALPVPAVVLDPNPGGISRFNGPVRIAPQGDLSMGGYTTEPTPAP